MKKHPFLVVIVTLLLSLVHSVSYAFSCADTATTGVPQVECEALVALYDSTDGDNWKNNTNWKTAMPVGSWYGINLFNGNVTYIDLSSNNLNGVLSDELAQLIKLASLKLNANQLTGMIPSELGQLTKLHTLYLSSNQLTGTIPSELGQLTNLQKLYLSQNQLTGTIPSELGQLAKLQLLYLSSNQLTGT
ncbi:leucine-rich repeat domain-containing protein, partial [Candidatus Albibeggiatoa sp. nov. NOAA]|uniref:leucine-rich repeat domain-containing protein n=1 Tax=Candidatus Albibeggiatoa sp. nov. NOAA TaxID=3162724 RepID=UPI0033042B6B|nr:leucine-rich repeat domain-containing protein [Thiotrichaceae bacterium]